MSLRGSCSSTVRNGLTQFCKAEKGTRLPTNDPLWGARDGTAAFILGCKINPYWEEKPDSTLYGTLLKAVIKGDGSPFLSAHMVESQWRAIEAVGEAEFQDILMYEPCTE